MQYQHQPIEDMLQMLHSRFPDVKDHPYLEDLYFPGGPFHQYRVLGDRYKFEFVEDGPKHSYVYITDYESKWGGSCYTVEEFAERLSQIEAVMK